MPAGLAFRYRVDMLPTRRVKAYKSCSDKVVSVARKSPSRLARPARHPLKSRGLVRSSVTFAASKRAAGRFQQSRRLDSRPFPAANGAPLKFRTCSSRSPMAPRRRSRVHR